jgi:Fe-S-cluster containining protein
MRQDRRWHLFKCQRCGKCCTEIGLPYDPKSIFEIATFLNLAVDQVIGKYYGRVVEDGKYWESEDHKRTPCPFLTLAGDRKCCAIYSVRPLGCRLYPFETDLGRAGVDCAGASIVYAKLEEEEEACGREHS